MHSHAVLLTLCVLPTVVASELTTSETFLLASVCVLGGLLSIATGTLVYCYCLPRLFPEKEEQKETKVVVAPSVQKVVRPQPPTTAARPAAPTSVSTARAPGVIATPPPRPTAPGPSVVTGAPIGAGASAPAAPPAAAKPAAPSAPATPAAPPAPTTPAPSKPTSVVTGAPIGAGDVTMASGSDEDD